MVIRAPKTDATATTPTAAAAAAAAAPTSASAGAPTSATSTENQPRPAPNPTGAFPFGLGGFPGMGNLNFANANFGEMQQQLQQQVCFSPMSNLVLEQISCRS